MSPADTSLGAKGQTRAWFWDLMHRMGPATTKTPNTGMRIWKIFACDIFWQELLHQEYAYSTGIGFVQDTRLLLRARLRIVRVLFT
jgi:hypothetical protein